MQCLVVEARTIPAGEKCSCAAPALEARRDLLSTQVAAKAEILTNPAATAAGWNCFCEMVQLEGKELEACQNDTSPAPKTKDGTPADGWCYIDPTSTPPAGNRALVNSCPSAEQRKLRFVGKGEQLDHSTLFITCASK